MAICIDGNVVCFGGGCFSQTPTGIEFSGEAVADSFVDCLSLQGSVSGYNAGGENPTVSPRVIGIIEKFSFASDGNATDVGDMSHGRYGGTGHQSGTHGYIAGGQQAPDKSAIDKFPFASDGNATDVGETFGCRYHRAAHSSFEHGYSAGGWGSYFPASNIIQRFPFASDGPSSDVGDLSEHGRACLSGHSSFTHGYSSGGICHPWYSSTDKIDKFPFVASANATDVAELTSAKTHTQGHHSVTDGYATGGPGLSTIDKFPFASDASATDTAELASDAVRGEGTSSKASGYVAGGLSPLSAAVDTIQKFPFSAESPGSDVGELTQPNQNAAGSHF